MLSRASSDAGTRLRRSKSTSTVRASRTPAPEHLDLRIAQHHAVAAAATAFVRAHSTMGEGRGLSSELTRAKSNASRKSQGSHFPARQSSFKSLRAPKMAPVFEAARTPRTSTPVTEKFPMFHATPDLGHSSAAQSSIACTENARPNSQPQSKPHRQSASSSVTSQQIRKARSMYYASSVQTGSPIARPPAKYLVTPPPLSSAPNSLVLPTDTGSSGVHHIPIIPGSPPKSPRLPVTITSGETVDKARDRYLQTFQQRQVKHKPSLLLAPFRKRQDKGRSMTIATASIVVEQDRYQTPTEITHVEALEDVKPLKEKRSFSNSLKHKFKKVFRRSSRGTTNTTVPAQQAEASRDYFGDFTTFTGSVSSVPTNREIPSPDELILHRVKARSPSLEVVGRPAFARPNSRGSSRSLHSECELNNSVTSRVTSWSNSSAGGTLTQREMKRLTVIHEAKDSIGSETESGVAALSSKRKLAPMPGLTAFRDPMPMECLVEEASTPIDPKRVFSALMKEIDATKATQSETRNFEQKPGIECDVFLNKSHSQLSGKTDENLHRVSCTDLHRTSKATSMKSSSMKSFSRAIRTTIRAVTPSEKRSSPVLEHTASVRGTVRIPRATKSDSPSSSESDLQGPETDEGNITGTINFRMRPRNHSCQTSSNGNVITPTREQVESRIQKSESRWQTQLQGSNITPMPLTTTQFSEDVTPEHPSGGKSAYTPREIKRQEAMRTFEQRAEPRSPSSPKLRTLFSPLSPSVYSRNTDGISILPDDSVVSLNGTEDDAGSAIITTSTAVKSYVIGTPTRGPASHSTRSSRDWRAWLSHEVSELEYSPREDLIIHDIYATPTGHRREFTEITDEGPCARTSSDSSSVNSPSKYSITVETPTHLHASGESDVLCEDLDSKTSASKLTIDIPTVQKISSLAPSDLIHDMEWPASNSSNRISLSPTQQAPERINERFPSIYNSRRGSSNSVEPSQYTHSSAGSCTPSSKIASSPKPYLEASINGPDDWPRTTRRTGADVDEMKENTTPSSSVRTAHCYRPSTPHNMGRPKSLQLMSSSTLNRTQASFAQYTTSAKDMKVSCEQPSTVSRIPRVRLPMQLVSPVKLMARPTSAFDLRNSTLPTPIPSPPSFLGSNCPRKKHQLQPRLKTERKFVLEDKDLGITIENSHVVTEPPSPLFSSRASKSNLRRQTLHLRTSTSTLALNKEPSPGFEERGIDALVEVGENNEDAVGRGRSSTPGQRMAEQFLQERSAGSGAASPTSFIINGTDRREKEDTPAFV